MKIFTIPVQIQGKKSQTFRIVAKDEAEALIIAQRLVEKMVKKMNEELKSGGGLPN